MTGLMIKDFINLKRNLKMFAVIILLYGFMAFASGDASFFGTIFTVLFAILTLSLYSYDELANWDIYALTMPVSKENIVQSKFIMMLLLNLIGIAFGAVFTIAIKLFRGDSIMSFDVRSSCIAAAIGILFYAVMIPFITKLGVEKARIILFMVYLIPFALFYFISNAVKSGKVTIPEQITGLIGELERYAVIIIPLILILALFVSYLISINIYRKKEF
jgi:hypothetical protein